MRTSIKRVRSALNSGDPDAATQALSQAIPLIDRMAQRGLIHKNTAARYKSRLNQRLKSLVQ